MVYLIQVGTYSRRQTFNKLYEKAVLVDDKYTAEDINRYFSEKYEGFSITVKKIKEVELTDIQSAISVPSEKPQPQNAPKAESVIKDFNISYTEDERKLHEEWHRYIGNADITLLKLHNSIEQRYRRLFYGDGTPELETNYRGTTCKNFPVKARLFIETAKKCDDTVPAAPVEQETPTSHNTTPEFDAESGNHQPQTEGDYDSNRSGAYSSDDIPF
ncbi:hypothetical protein [Treponema sp. R6D11]